MKYQKIWIASRTREVYLLSEIEIKGRMRDALPGEMIEQPTPTIITPIVDEATNTKLGVFSKLIRRLGLVGIYSRADVPELEKIYHTPPSQVYVHRAPSFTLMADHRVRNFSK